MEFLDGFPDWFRTSSRFIFSIFCMEGDKHILHRKDHRSDPPFNGDTIEIDRVYYISKKNSLFWAIKLPGTPKFGTITIYLYPSSSNFRRFCSCGKHLLFSKIWNRRRFGPTTPGCLGSENPPLGPTFQEIVVQVQIHSHLFEWSVDGLKIRWTKMQLVYVDMAKPLLELTNHSTYFNFYQNLGRFCLQ